MTHIKYALKIQRYRKIILKRMKLLKMKTAEVAALGNLGIVTVSNFLEERTFSPQIRTIESMLEGVGCEIVVIEKSIANNKVETGRCRS